MPTQGRVRHAIKKLTFSISKSHFANIPVQFGFSLKFVNSQKSQIKVVCSVFRHVCQDNTWKKMVESIFFGKYVFANSRNNNFKYEAEGDSVPGMYIYINKYIICVNIKTNCQRRTTQQSKRKIGEKVFV